MPKCSLLLSKRAFNYNLVTLTTSVTDTIDAGVASLREHKAYLDGLGGDFDPDEFLRNMAGFVGLAAGCEYAVGLRRYPV